MYEKGKILKVQVIQCLRRNIGGRGNFVGINDKGEISRLCKSIYKYVIHESNVFLGNSWRDGDIASLYSSKRISQSFMFLNVAQMIFISKNINKLDCIYCCFHFSSGIESYELSMLFLEGPSGKNFV